jgi:ParB family chromosome partitioning protein
MNFEYIRETEYIPLKDLNYSQKREYSEEELEELEQSIWYNGQLNPIIIDENNNVLAGNMRCIALERLDYKTVFVLRNKSELLNEEILIADNEIRKNLTPIEKANLLKTIKDHYQINIGKLSFRTGVSVNKIIKLLKIADLRDEIKSEYEHIDIPESVLTEVTKVPKEKQQELVDDLGGLENTTAKKVKATIEVKAKVDSLEEDKIVLNEYIKEMELVQEAKTHITKLNKILSKLNTESSVVNVYLKEQLLELKNNITRFD